MTGPTLTEQMLALAQEVVAGRAAPEALRPMVTTLAGGMMGAQTQFVHEASGNPEVPQDRVQTVLEAFQRFGSGLETMVAAISAGDRGQIEQAAAVVSEAANTIKSQQDEYQAAVARNGPTGFPYLNRLLIHLHWMMEGGTETRFTLATLNDLPQFVARVQDDVRTQEQRVQHGEARQLVDEACKNLAIAGHELATQLQQGVPPRESLESMRDRIGQVAEQLAQGLGAYVETSLSSGPTPILVVNLLLQAVENWQSGIISAGNFRVVVEQTVNTLRGQVEQIGNSDLAMAFDEVETVLLRMDNAASQDALEDVLVLMPRLRDAAYELATRAATGAGPPDFDDEESLLDLVHGAEGIGARPQAGPLTLPSNLQRVLDIANAYLAGGASASDLQESIDAMERQMIGTRNKATREAGRTPGAEKLVPPLEKGLDSLQEALNCLRALLQDGDRRALDAARGLMTQATEQLLAVTEMQV
ncbi:MAG: hypothetical protein ACYCW6_28565 [Candidatus Xenobia bacterium]